MFWGTTLPVLYSLAMLYTVDCHCFTVTARGNLATLMSIVFGCGSVVQYIKAYKKTLLYEVDFCCCWKIITVRPFIPSSPYSATSSPLFCPKIPPLFVPLIPFILLPYPLSLFCPLIPFIRPKNPFRSNFCNNFSRNKKYSPIFSLQWRFALCAWHL